jgi:hypothetical protein
LAVPGVDAIRIPVSATCKLSGARKYAIYWKSPEKQPNHGWQGSSLIISWKALRRLETPVGNKREIWKQSRPRKFNTACAFHFSPSRASDFRLFH